MLLLPKLSHWAVVLTEKSLHYIFLHKIFMNHNECYLFSCICQVSKKHTSQTTLPIWNNKLFIADAEHALMNVQKSLKMPANTNSYPTWMLKTKHDTNIDAQKHSFSNHQHSLTFYCMERLLQINRPKAYKLRIMQ